MNTKAYAGWLSAGFDIWQLNAEAVTVTALAMAHIAAGGPARSAKAWVMVLEKVEAVMELHTRLMTGELGHTAVPGMQATLNHYRGKVAANSQRLGRKR